MEEKVREALKGLLLEGHGVGNLYLGKKERLSVKNIARASNGDLPDPSRALRLE